MGGPAKRTCATLAIASGLVLTSPARGQDCVSLEVRRCEEWLDADSLARAFEAESGVRVQCTAPVVAMLRVHCSGARTEVRVNEGTPQSYELATIPASVRSRIMALLLAERLRDFFAARASEVGRATTTAAQSTSAPEPATFESPPSPGQPSPGQPSPGQPSPGQPPPQESPDEPAADIEAAPEASHDPRPPTLGRSPGGRLASGGGLASPTPRGARSWRAPAHPVALWVFGSTELEPAGSPRIRVAGDVTVFARPLTAVVGPALAVAVGPLRAEIGWSVGTATHRLGTTDLALGRASVGLRVSCTRWPVVSVCGSVWGSVGHARATPRPNLDALSADASGPYGSAAVELSASVATEWVAFELALRAGYGSGLVLVADGRELAALGGPFFGVNLGLELAPF